MAGDHSHAELLAPCVADEAAFDAGKDCGAMAGPQPASNAATLVPRAHRLRPKVFMDAFLQVQRNRD